MTPMRLQRRRTRGYMLPEGTVCCTRPGKWCNPFVVHSDSGPSGKLWPMTPQIAVGAFRSMLTKDGAWFPVPLPWPKGKIPACEPTMIEDVRRELRGKNLARFCKLCPDHRDGKPLGVKCAACSPCHVDVLLEISNEGANAT